MSPLELSLGMFGRGHSAGFTYIGAVAAVFGFSACSNAPAPTAGDSGAYGTYAEGDGAGGTKTSPTPRGVGSGGNQQASSNALGVVADAAGAAGTQEGGGTNGLASSSVSRVKGASGGSSRGSGGSSSGGTGGAASHGSGGSTSAQGGAAAAGNSTANAGGAAGSRTSTDLPGVGGSNVDGGPPQDKGVVEVVDIADAWSRHPTAFALLTRQDQQFAAFYDSQRYMTVVQRTIGTGKGATGSAWTSTKKLSPQLVQCDSHNYVTMAIDRNGYIHVSGNMHGDPLVYYRSTAPLDVTTLTAATPMVSGAANEGQATYPQFFFDMKGDLIFAYRDGASGNGNYVFNKYNDTSKTWARLLASPLINGTADNLSAYPVGPVRGPDDWFHLVWVWRESANAETNKDLSYAKTQDFVNWKTATGAALTLPITHSTAGIIVDPVPTKGGMINNNTKIGFDSQGRVILSYHKNDAKGTQLFNARREGNSWAIHQTSNWDWTWPFSGQGTLEFDIVVEPVTLQTNGDLVENWFNRHYNGWGAFTLDPNTLAAKSTIAPILPYPSDLDKPQSTTSGMTVQWAQDSGAGPDPSVHYVLRWETLPSNRDQCPSSTPPATRLRVYGIR